MWVSLMQALSLCNVFAFLSMSWTCFLIARLHDWVKAPAVIRPLVVRWECVGGKWSAVLSFQHLFLRERENTEKSPTAGSPFKIILAGPVLCQSWKLRSQPGFPTWTAGTEQHEPPQGTHLQEAGSRSVAGTPGTLMWELGFLTAVFFVGPDTCPGSQSLSRPLFLDCDHSMCFPVSWGCVAASVPWLTEALLRAQLSKKFRRGQTW